MEQKASIGPEILEDTRLKASFEQFKKHNSIFSNEEINFSESIPESLIGDSLDDGNILGWGELTHYNSLPGRNTFHYNLESGEWSFAGFACETGNIKDQEGDRVSTLLN